MSNSNYKAVQNLLDIYHQGDLETKKIAVRAIGRAGVRDVYEDVVTPEIKRLK